MMLKLSVDCFTKYPHAKERDLIRGGAFYKAKEGCSPG